MTSLLTRVPILGWFIRSAVNGSYAERIALILNVLVLYGIAVAYVGYPLVIVTALTLTGLYLLGLVLLTSQGLWSKATLD